MEYTELARVAAEAPAFRSLIQPDDPRFLRPGDMATRISEYCRETAQPATGNPRGGDAEISSKPRIVV
jgi:rhamnulokinase